MMPTLRSRHWNSLWACLLLGVLFALPAAATVRKPASRSTAHIPTAEALFVKVLQSDDLFTYRGRQITTYWQSGKATDVEVIHQPEDNRRICYLNPERQRGRLLVSDGHQQWEYDPRAKTLLCRPLSPGALDDDDLLSYTLLRQNYLLSVDPAPRVWADRPVSLVTIKRPVRQTLARRFWIDSGTGVILKRELYREDGRLAVTVAFSDITFHPHLLPGMFSLAALARMLGVRVVRLPTTSEAVLPLTNLPSQLAGTAAAPSTLAGYRLVGATATTLSGKPLLHLRYSDGLNLVSLFELRRTQLNRPTLVPPGTRSTQIGPLTAHITRRASLTTLNWDTPTLNITLMGEIGLTSLRTLALAAIRSH